MRAGYSGTFVISWSQTEVDGFEAETLGALRVGSSWTWHGEAVRVDGPADILRLDRAEGTEALRRRAARRVRQLVGQALERPEAHRPDPDDDDAQLIEQSFVVTDGAQSFTVTVIEVGGGARPLLMFLNEMPPQNTDLWVVHHTLGAAEAASTGPDTGGVICFTPGTWITTPDGPCLIEELREGDRVQTKDNGAQKIRWIGARRMTGARLFAMPYLRPVRIHAGALGVERPEQSLLVSPNHRMVVQGEIAQALFNTPEVLVSAKDLINGDTITVDLAVKEVTYVHLMLENHQVLWANGVETESFHPANTALSTLSDEDRARLLAGMPDLQFDPHVYGDYARRNLSASEAAILRHAA